MKLLVQKVARATVEVDGLIEGRIGTGAVLHLAVPAGATVEAARRLAECVAQLKLWPDLGDQETPCKSTVVENGFELLVVLQQSLCSSFPRFEPRAKDVADASEAKRILEAFTKFLQTEYQEEMVVAAPVEPGLRVEALCECPGLFELDSMSLSGAQPRAAVTKAAVVEPQDTRVVELPAEVAAVTKALRQLPLHNKTRAVLETCRIFRVFSMKKFRVALSEAAQLEADAFAEALDEAAKYFSAKQLDQITSWTGLTIMSKPRDDEALAEDEDDAKSAAGGEAQDDLGGGDLDEQLAQLQEEVQHPELARKRKRAQAQAAQAAQAAAKAAKAKAAKEAEKDAEAAEAEAEVVRRRPDWKGRAAPDTPAAASARAWVQSRAGQRQQWSQAAGGKGKGGKGKSGPRPWRSLGIASLDTSARLHGNSAAAAGYATGQWSEHGDRGNKFLKKEEGVEEDEEEAAAKKKRGVAPMPRLPKGTPTLAPMCPAPGEEGEEGEAQDDF